MKIIIEVNLKAMGKLTVADPAFPQTVGGADPAVEMLTYDFADFLPETACK